MNLGKLQNKIKGRKQQMRRETDIVAYRGAICNQKGCPMIYLKVLCTIQGPNSKDENVICLQALFQTDIAYLGPLEGVR